MPSLGKIIKKLKESCIGPLIIKKQTRKIYLTSREPCQWWERKMINSKVLKKTYLENYNFIIKKWKRKWKVPWKINSEIIIASKSQYKKTTTHLKWVLFCFYREGNLETWVYIKKKSTRTRNSKDKLFLFLTNELLAIIVTINLLCVVYEQVQRGALMKLEEGLERTCSYNLFAILEEWYSVSWKLSW